MAELLRKIFVGYNYLFDEVADPRTKDYLFIAKPYQGLTLIALYLFYVLKWGPSWMKNRQPYNLKKILIVYNLIQVLCCSYIGYKGIQLGWFWKFKMFCEPVDTSYSDHALEITFTAYLYFLMKIFDLLDTVFIVLRKKNNQVSFLHLYHHAGMVALIWGGITYLPGGHTTLIGVINSFVHAVMYLYYLLNVITPSIKEHIWFKKLITQLQIIQFLWFVIHMGALVFKSDCDFPKWTAGVFLPQNVFMLILFIDFYIKAYIKKPQAKNKSAVNGSRNNFNNDGDKDANNIENDVISNRLCSDFEYKSGDSKESDKIKFSDKLNVEYKNIDQNDYIKKKI